MLLATGTPRADKMKAEIVEVLIRGRPEPPVPPDVDSFWEVKFGWHLLKQLLGEGAQFLSFDLL